MFGRRPTAESGGDSALRRGLPAFLGALAVSAFFGILAFPGVVLATRDFAFFHLPLRTDFARLVSEGIPYWNPWIHAGQPLLSNPSYGAFYPPSWLVLAFDPGHALGLLVIFHAVIAFAGAWCLARHLGCGTGASAFAAVAFIGAGSFLSLLHAYTLFGAMAWLPWVLIAGDLLLSGDSFRWRPALGCGVALALQLLNGEPVTALVGFLALAVFAGVRGVAPERAPETLAPEGALGSPAPERALGSPAPEGARWSIAPRVALRSVVPVLLALALASPQLLPTAVRLADSPRQGSLEMSAATTWSAPPQRLLELASPRIFGDPMRWEEGLFFGASLHDRHYPYLVSIYPGLLVLLLAITALVHGCPRRLAFLGMILLGVLLALGRFNPLYGLFYEYLPLLGKLRYPEKFLLLALATLPFLAALGWHRLLDERRRGRTQGTELALILALAVAVFSAGVAVLASVGPDSMTVFLLNASNDPATPENTVRALRYLAGEQLWTAVVATLSAALLWAMRFRRVRATWLSVALVCLVGVDLWRSGASLVRTIPAADLKEPPAIIAPLLPMDSRVFTDEMLHPLGGQIRVGEGSEVGLGYEYVKTSRLDPYAGNLWGVGYALHVDFDLMLTRWGSHGLERLREDIADMDRAAALLGAWNVEYLILRLPKKEAMVQPDEPPFDLNRNGWVLPRYRFVPRVIFHPDPVAATDAQRAAPVDYRPVDHWIDVDSPTASSVARPSPRPRARLLSVEEKGSLIEIAYEAEGEGGFLVVASTFDDGWRARVDGEALEVFPTALGQLGVAVPAGSHRLELSFRDPVVDLGALLGLLAWGILLPLLWWRGPTLWPAGAAATVSAEKSSADKQIA